MRSTSGKTVLAPDPDSLLRRYLGDRRFLIVLPRAVTLQTLHPMIAASFTEHVYTG